MIIETQEDVTRAVLAEMHRTPDARTKEILAGLVKHLHAFVKRRGSRWCSQDTYGTSKESPSRAPRSTGFGRKVQGGEGTFLLEFTFVLSPGESVRPAPPITGKQLR